MSDSRSAAAWKVWGFVQGEIAPGDLLTWIYSDEESERTFGPSLHHELIFADPRDPHVMYRLKERLFEWAVSLPRSGCRYWDYLHRHPMAFEDLSELDLGNRIERRLLSIGYWHSPNYPALPHPRDFVDLEWDRAERDRVTEYTRNAYRYCGSCGYSWCRMGCSGIPYDIGVRCLTDGTWRFPEGFAHYIAHHSVKPEAEFLDHVRRNGYRAPVLPLERITPLQNG